MKARSITKLAGAIALAGLLLSSADANAARHRYYRPATRRPAPRPVPPPKPPPPKMITLKGMVVGNSPGRSLSVMDDTTKGTQSLGITPATKFTFNEKTIEQKALPKYARVTVMFMDNDLKAKEVKATAKQRACPSSKPRFQVAAIAPR